MFRKLLLTSAAALALLVPLGLTGTAGAHQWHGRDCRGPERHEARYHRHPRVVIRPVVRYYQPVVPAVTIQPVAPPVICAPAVPAAPVCR